MAARLARAVVRGATLGGLPLEPWSPVVGYVMFGAAAAYLAGLWLLARLPSPVPAVPALSIPSPS
jgi:hypothetical protein